MSKTLLFLGLNSIINAMQNNIYKILPLFYLHCILGQSKQPNTLFDTDYFNAVNHWVVLPQNLPSETFLLGYVYPDPHQGFTFVFEDELKLSPRKNWQRINTDNNAIIRFVLDLKSPKLHLLNAQTIKKFKLPIAPAWIELMSYDSESWIESARKFMKKRQYHEAIHGFESAFKQNRAIPNLAFELALAFNSAEQYPKCIAHLMRYLPLESTDYRLYRELGFALVQLHQAEEAEKIYEQGLQVCQKSEEKREMALDMAQTFYRLRDQQRFEKWAKILRHF
ncbi:hypothetical protein KIH23_09655 [Flavobacterium sp. CYK-55]|uniref:tetratricopeptide repeat protein n=1 Tax=Flavobacterium sp. CYK-55 TaxID=2835529 RepID=UPI001BCF9F2A|nr:hypothetical protein [Flavobacterium sp. CYK-55]MBS7787560.1 hypothetical protein [Flavobacterium sp. CYK-55]